MSFNGAAAQVPRKSRDITNYCWGDGGFNGAAAQVPRKSPGRFAVRGSLTSLQWSRGTSAAEMLWGVERVRVIESLQWSRGTSAAEIRPITSNAPSRCWLQWSRGTSAAEMGLKRSGGTWST